MANGVVYVGSWDAKLYALDASTGAKKWDYTTGGQVHSSPALPNGVVYVGSYDGKLYAFNATTGGLLSGWPVSTGGGITSSPAVANGVVYVGSYDNKLYAFNAFNGNPYWAAVTGGQIDFSSPAVTDGYVYIGSKDGRLYAYTLEEGGWRMPRSASPSRRPRIPSNCYRTSACAWSDSRGRTMRGRGEKKGSLPPCSLNG